MKIRKTKRIKYWIVYPYNFKKYSSKSFKYKKQAINYLISMGDDALNSYLSYEINQYNSSYTLREYFVWYNQYQIEHQSSPNFKLVLTNIIFYKKNNSKYSKYVFKKSNINKKSVRFFSLSDKTINLMCYIGDNKNIVNDNNYINLIKLFIKRFNQIPLDCPDYSHALEKYDLNNFDSWFHWSDRCFFQRAALITNIIFKNKPHIKKYFLGSDL